RAREIRSWSLRQGSASPGLFTSLIRPAAAVLPTSSAGSPGLPSDENPFDPYHAVQELPFDLPSERWISIGTSIPSAPDSIVCALAAGRAATWAGSPDEQERIPQEGSLSREIGPGCWRSTRTRTRPPPAG